MRQYQPEKKFEIGDRVRFNLDGVNWDYGSYFLAYMGHEFEVVGYMPNEGVEFNLDDEDWAPAPFSHDEPCYDHLKLRCLTGDVVVQGCVHDDLVELVGE